MKHETGMPVDFSFLSFFFWRRVGWGGVGRSFGDSDGAVAGVQICKWDEKELVELKLVLPGVKRG